LFLKQNKNQKEEKREEDKKEKIDREFGISFPHKRK
jgi:hypothetical protein